ncbi:MAG: radical SAM family heme chaperone HemW, partial [Bacteroidota bacterium]
MLGVYFHIPFCRHACHYCDFHFSTQLKYEDLVLDAMRQEMAKRKLEWSEKVIGSIYLGGGTPSVLSEKNLMSLVTPLFKQSTNDTEITIEVNPEDVSNDFLKILRQLNFNRISIGIQSFFDDDLASMNRKHTGEAALSAVKRAQDFGIENITADLIYGIPNSSTSKFQENVGRLLELSLPHFSAYCLTVEKNTVYDRLERQGQLPQVSEDRIEDEFFYLHNRAVQHGFDHYELSNYALPGKQSVHNSNYWKRFPYVGFGPGAHSFEKNLRRWNVSNNQHYVRAIAKGVEDYFEFERLTAIDELNEKLMTELRTAKGIQFSDFPDGWKNEK